MKKVCIVIPCYNEADRLPVNKVIDFVQNNHNICLLLVDDGSTDQTFKIISELSKKENRIHHLQLEKNSGKAEAVRSGIMKATSLDVDLIGYLDADLATPLEEVNYLKEIMENNTNIVFAFGSRVKMLSNKIERKLSRHLTGRVFATFTSQSLKLPVYDTQCGCKLFKKDVVEPLFKKPFISPWMFDVEIFWRLIHLYGREKISNITKEVPLRVWIDPGASKITWKDTFKFPFEFYKIHRHYRKKK